MPLTLIAIYSPCKSKYWFRITERHINKCEEHCNFKVQSLHLGRIGARLYIFKHQLFCIYRVHWNALLLLLRSPFKGQLSPPKIVTDFNEMNSHLYSGINITLLMQQIFLALINLITSLKIRKGYIVKINV